MNDDIKNSTINNIMNWPCVNPNNYNNAL